MPGNVDGTGAPRRSVLEGIHDVNREMLILVDDPQPVGDGSIHGIFEVLAAGRGTYSDQLAKLVHQRADEEEASSKINDLLTSAGKRGTATFLFKKHNLLRRQ